MFSSGRQNSPVSASLFIILDVIVYFRLRYLDMSENSLTGFPAIPLWESTLVKELLFNRNNIAVVSIKCFVMFFSYFLYMQLYMYV